MNDPSALNCKLPLAGADNNETVIGSPEGSTSFPSTPGAGTVNT